MKSSPLSRAVSAANDESQPSKAQKLAQIAGVKSYGEIGIGRDRERASSSTSTSVLRAPLQKKLPNARVHSPNLADSVSPGTFLVLMPRDPAAARKLLRELAEVMEAEERRTQMRTAEFPSAALRPARRFYVSLAVSIATVSVIVAILALLGVAR